MKKEDIKKYGAYTIEYNNHKEILFSSGEIIGDEDSLLQIRSFISLLTAPQNVVRINQWTSFNRLVIRPATEEEKRELIKVTNEHIENLNKCINL